MTKRLLHCFSIFFCLLLSIGCTNTTDSGSKEFAIIKGKMNPSLLSKYANDSQKVTLYSMTHIDGEGYISEIPFEEDGNFRFDSIPVFCPTYCKIILPETIVWMFISPGEEIELSIQQSDAAGLPLVDVITGRRLTAEDSRINNAAFENIFYGYRPNWFLQTEMTPEEYDVFVKIRLDAIHNLIDNYPGASYNSKHYLKYYAGFRMLSDCILRYKNAWVDSIEHFPPLNEPADYRFLKYFSLNDPNAFYPETYTNVIRHLLADSVLNISPIEEMPIAVWLEETKALFAPLIGSDSGFFYDLLLANAYTKQIDDEMRPLSDKQIENIRSYFRDRKHAPLILKRNDFLLSVLNTPKQETPAVPNEALMSEIISRYEGKIVLVDFWATWCAPCLRAMNTMKSLKLGLKPGQIVYVYLAAPTSEEKLWNRYAYEFKGEHYRLSEDQWAYFEKTYKLDGIPSYLIFDKQGKLQHTITGEGYPGNQTISDLIAPLP